MRLVLMRHAQAAPGAVDSERPLTAAGRVQSLAAANGLARIRWGIARVVSSPARRCSETATAVATALGVGAVEVAAELGLDAPAGAAMAVLLADDRPTLAVGHAPDLAALAREFWGAVTLPFDCAGVAGFEVDRDGRHADLVFLLPHPLLAALHPD